MVNVASYRRRAAVSLVAWAAFFLLPATSGCRESPPANLLIVSLDTTRADRLGAYGYDRPTSPTLDQLAEQGALFRNAFTTAPSTLPAHSSLMTGLLPPGHGVRANGVFKLAEERNTLAEILSAHGFETGAVIGALPLDTSFGLAQGFDSYDGDFISGFSSNPGGEEGEWLGHQYHDFERRADDVTDRAIRWLEERQSRWFLFVHYFDPHLAYEPPGPWDARFEHPYDGEIAFADAELGRLLETVDELPGRTLIVLLSDHGEALGEHGEEAHNFYLYNSTLQVPLVIILDGAVEPGTTIEANVSLVDVRPTVLELLGLGDSDPIDGRSLAPALLSRGEPENGPVYGETLAPRFEQELPYLSRAVIDGDHKLIRSVTLGERKPEVSLELYDMRRDPAERTNLAGTETDLRDRLHRRLVAWSDRLEANAPRAERFDPDAETRRRLEALGYLK
jgi:arylsulfatase A-like enzyme